VFREDEATCEPCSELTDANTIANMAMTSMIALKIVICYPSMLLNLCVIKIVICMR